MDARLAIDSFVLLSYFTIIIFIGLRMGRKEDSLHDFALGGRRIPWWAVLALSFCSIPAFAQAPTPPAAPAPEPGVAARVNGQPVPEIAVQRGLERIDPAKRAQARPELIDYLVDNASGHQLLIFMDAFSGYNQIMMVEEDWEKTAFITESGGPYGFSLNEIFAYESYSSSAW